MVAPRACTKCQKLVPKLHILFLRFSTTNICFAWLSLWVWGTRGVACIYFFAPLTWTRGLASYKLYPPPPPTSPGSGVLSVRLWLRGIRGVASDILTDLAESVSERDQGCSQWYTVSPWIRGVASNILTDLAEAVSERDQGCSQAREEEHDQGLPTHTRS